MFKSSVILAAWLVITLLPGGNGIPGRVHIMNALTYGNRTFRVSTGVENAAIAVASILAGLHCEEKNGTFIPALAEPCPEVEFNFTSSDTELQPSTVVNTYLDNAENIDFVIGAVRSASTIPLSIVAGAKDTPVVSFMSSAQDLSNRETFSYFARTIPSDAETAKVLSKLLEMYELSAVGLVYMDDAYGNAYRDALLSGCVEHGIRLISFGHSPEQWETVHVAMNELKKEKLNVIIFVTYGYPLAIAVDFAMANNMIGENKLFVFADSVGFETLNAIAAQSKEHMKALQSQQWIVATAIDSERSTFQAFRSAWPNLGDDAKVVKYVNDRLPGGSQFLQARGSKYVYQIEPSFFAETGPYVENIAAYAFDTVASACISICKVAAKADQSDDKLVGQSIVDELFSESFPFEGASGKVEFDKSTGSRSVATATFKLYSIVPGETTISVKLASDWKSGKWNMASDLQFPGNTKAFPTTTDVPDPNLNQIPLAVKGTLYFFMGVIELICAWFIVWTIRYRRDPLILKSQPQFLVICLVGVMISTFSIYFLSVDDGEPHSESQASFACNASWAFWSCGSTIVTAALIVKLYRIWRIFHNPSLRTLRISNMDLYLKIGAILFLNSIVLAIWFSILPLQWVRHTVQSPDIPEGSDSALFDAFGNVVSSYGYCDTQSYEGSDYVPAFAFQFTLLAFNFLQFIIAGVLSYKVRHVDSDFQESLYFFLAIFCMLQLYALGLPVILAIHPGATTVRFLVLASLIAINNLVFTLLLMLPKVFKFDVNSAFGSTPKQTIDRNATINETKEKQHSYRQTEEIYTLSNDIADEFQMDFSSVQGPSLNFSEMYPSARPGRASVTSGKEFAENTTAIA